MKRQFQIVRAVALLVTMLTLYSCSENSKIEDLSHSFISPDSSSKPGAFWCWLNGGMTKERITFDLESMKAKGMNRAEIWDVAATNKSDMVPAGGAFLGDESVELIKHALSEGKRLGMAIGMIASSGWNAGGTWVTPDWASKALFHSETKLIGPKSVSIDLDFPELPALTPRNGDGTPVFYKEVAVKAFPYNKDRVVDPSKIIDLQSYFLDGKLKWDIPEGEWIVLRFVCSNTGQYLIVPTPNSKGLFIDFLDPKATEKHFGYILNRLGITPQNASESGMSYLEFDSMELAEGTPWTDQMPEVFNDMRGYSLDNYYAALAGWKFSDNSDVEFMYDFKKTVSDRLIFSHYTTGSKFLENYGMNLVAEAGGPGPPIWKTCPVDALKALGNVSVPRGEFWIKHRGIFLIKEVSSAAHIYGKKYVDAESFTTWRRWIDSPFVLKASLDRAFVEGLNTVTFHTYASSMPEDGYPGRTYHAGIDINPGTTWWGKSAPFMEYITRCCEMLRKGFFVADVCYYYGDKAPNFFPAIQGGENIPRIEELSEGYDFDVVNSDVIINRMSSDGGRIVLPDGMSYSIMILQKSEEMRLEVLKKIDTLVDAGVIVLGAKPVTIPGLHTQEDFAEFKALTDRLWDSGKIYSGMTGDQLLQKNSICPDFSFKGDTLLNYIHRRDGDCDIYFVANAAKRGIKGRAQFRVEDSNVEVWDPSTGCQYSVENYSVKDGVTEIELELAPHGSMFVVFSDKSRNLPKYMPNVECREELINAPWVVNFDREWGGPEECTFQELKSWSEFLDEGIKYYSGTAVYNKIIDIDSEDVGKKCEIDLGVVKDVAEVFVNGESAGIVWKYPYRVDVSHLLKEGENKIQIDIVNLWANRLLGDLQLEPEDRYCWTNNNWKGDKLLESGLLGPVKLCFQD